MNFVCTEEILMKIVKCGDLGFKCNFMAAGHEIDEVEKTMWDHIEKEHKKKLENMSEDDIHHLKHRISTLLGRSCGCGAL
jgi:predicted small metal-binding protein